MTTCYILVSFSPLCQQIGFAKSANVAGVFTDKEEAEKYMNEHQEDFTKKFLMVHPGQEEEIPNRLRQWIIEAPILDDVRYKSILDE